MTIKHGYMRAFTAAFALTTPIAYGQTALSDCVMKQFLNADEHTTIAQIRKLCLQSKQQSEKQIDNTSSGLTLGAISRRIIQEKQTQFERYVILPHKLNYFLPALSTNVVNREAYDSLNGFEENLKDVEAKLQISLKVPMNRDSILIENDSLYLGFTLQAWWQIYANKISKPFRETNYQPEIFYLAPLPWHPFGGNTGFIVGFEHQSNGRGLDLSRSWNRFYTHLMYEKDNFAMSFKPWVRLAENEKTFAQDPSGDDNPDIDDYLGHFELGLMYKWDSIELSFTGRQNFATNKGSAELGLTFPLWGKLRGYATTFSGYGESLIDYNHHQTRFGLGIALGNAL
jgi:phospholipase A1